jgi:hypothetical protein
MNGLLRIQSTSSSDLYIPVDSIKSVSRTAAAQITIVTDPVSPDRTGSYNAPSYQLTEGGTGAGEFDETNVQAIIDAWSSVLRGQQAVATVNFSFPVDRFSKAMVAWP